jgi:anti-sigma B factor antagonist
MSPERSIPPTPDRPPGTLAFELHDESLPGGAHVIAARGEIDLFTAPELRRRLFELIDGGSVQLVLDLSGTTFIDSTALGVLIGATKRLRPRDGRLVIVNVEPSIQRTLRITGLDRIFTLVPTREEAVRALAELG